MPLQRNVIANYLGQGWVALMGIAFLPLYVRVLGFESYGLIGFFTILQGWMVLLDFGITPALNREMARLEANVHTAESIRDLLRSLEVVYAGIALLVMAVVGLAADWLARDWLKIQGLQHAGVVEALRLMGFALAARCAELLYRGALVGLQDQVWFNAVQALFATLRWGGAYLVIAHVVPSLTAFFAWQGLVSLLAVPVLARRTRRLLPPLDRAGRFAWAALADIRHFAAGMFLITLLSTLLMYGDKLLISKLLPLEVLGHYMLATSVANGLLQLAVPMNTAVLPRLTALAAREDTAELASIYLRACEWIAAVLVPSAMVLVFFPASALLLWTGDASLTRPVAPLLIVLSLGTLFNGLMNIPYMLQLAYGWTGLAVRINLVAVLLLGPIVYLVVPIYGAMGAAVAWLILNAGYTLIGARLMYRRLLPETRNPWYLRAVAAPVSTAALIGAGLAWCLPQPSSRAEAAATIAFAGLVLASGVFLALPTVRHQILSRLTVVFRPRT